MILTKKFVYIHLPKTGGTFVTSVLERLMKPPRARNYFERALRRLRPPVYRDRNKHGTAREVPESHRGLPVFTTIRNPFDRYVSQYNFAWWRKQTREWAEEQGVLRKFPRFPDLSFEEFVDAAGLHGEIHGTSSLSTVEWLGTHSEQFVRYFFRDPAAAWPRIDDAYIAERRWEQDLLPVKFLRQENLNRDLHAFLLENGFEPASIQFILDEGRILPAGPKRDHGKPLSEWYTPELRAKILRRERLYFALFPEYAR